jgi:hypothetical protein
VQTAHTTILALASALVAVKVKEQIDRCESAVMGKTEFQAMKAKLDLKLGLNS